MLEDIRISLNKNGFKNVNLYYQDESRFGLKTFVGKCLSVAGVRPLVQYQHRFSNTYLWGSFSPITGDRFVWEIDGVNKEIFCAYLEEFSRYKPDEFKVLVIDNAAFHSVKDFDIPKNIALINIPPYSPELNPCEQVWQYIKKRFKNKTFENMELLREWLYETLNAMDNQKVKSITSNHHYLKIFMSVFMV